MPEASNAADAASTTAKIADALHGDMDGHDALWLVDLHGHTAVLTADEHVELRASAQEHILESAYNIDQC